MLVPITGSFRASQVIFELLFGTLGLCFIIKRNFKLSLTVGSLLFITLGASLIIFLVGIFARGSIIRSLSDSTRLIFLSIYMGVGYSYANSKCYSEEFILRVLFFYMVTSILFSLFVYVNFTYPMINLFKGRQSEDELPLHFFRFSGFSGFPTDFGSILVFGFCLMIADQLNTIWNLKWKIFFTTIFLFGIIGSGSRGAILQLICVLFLFFVIKFLRYFLKLRILKSTIKFFTVFILAGIVFIYIIYYSYKYYNKNTIIDSVINYLSVNFYSPDESIEHRFSEIKGSFDVLFNKGFLFGEERDYPFGLPVIEGFHTHWISRYSWLGLIIGVGLCVFLIRISFKSKTKIGFGLGIWTISFLVSVGLFSDILFRFKGPLLYGFLFGICLFFFKIRRKNYRSFKSNIPFQEKLKEKEK